MFPRDRFCYFMNLIAYKGYEPLGTSFYAAQSYRRVGPETHRSFTHIDDSRYALIRIVVKTHQITI